MANSAVENLMVVACQADLVDDKKYNAALFHHQTFSSPWIKVMLSIKLLFLLFAVDLMY